MSVTSEQQFPGLDVRYVRELPERSARYGAWPTWCGPGTAVRTAVEQGGIDRLWAHQTVAADALAAGRSVVLTTGTASGKSLAYLLPVASAALGELTDAGSGAAAGSAAPGLASGDPPVRWRRRPATSLYLAPTKALAHDQARRCAELDLPGWRVATVDGDTATADRRWARDHAHHVLTNPDLLHASLLPQHARWASFLRSLRYVVIDESHRYRGVFGAQVAAVLRRLRRLADFYGARPTFAVLSATAADAVVTASALTGLAPPTLLSVTEDDSPRGPVRISLARSSAAAEDAAAEVLAAQVRAGRQTLTFVPSRRGAEQVARSAGLLTGGPAGEIVAYRAGFLAADRRLIERGLADGAVRGVAATNALELGVDITGLDTVVLCGYPGNRAAFWQQAGRAGRRGAAAEVVLIARPNPVDAHLLDHPSALFDAPVETPALDPESPPVLGPQLAAAAQELPLRPGDERWFGPRTPMIVARLTELGLLRRRPDGWYWTSAERAVDRIDLRTADARHLDIVEEPTGRVLGTVGIKAADLVVHPGAVYLHQGDTYLCGETDVEAGEAYVRAVRAGYLTQPLVETSVLPGAPERVRRPGDRQPGRVSGADGGNGRDGVSCAGVEAGAGGVGDAGGETGAGGARLAYGPVRVTSRVTGFFRRDEITGRVWDSTPLDCPERVLATTAITLTVPTAVLADAGGPATDGPLTDGALTPPSRARRDAGLHALEHLLVGLLPAVVVVDRGDIGAHSWLSEDGLGVVAVFERQPGSGIAVRAYERAEAWIIAAADRIAECPCASGCPSCILSPGCGTTRPLDKATCRRLLTTLVTQPSPHVGSPAARADRDGGPNPARRAKSGEQRRHGAVAATEETGRR